MINFPFDINETTLPIIAQMAEHMPGGFFIYHATGNEEFILVNKAILRLTACESMEQFQELTGNSFKGFVHPEDIERTEESIAQQISENEHDNDYVEYRITCCDGGEKWIRDYGHLVHTECYGDIFYVFVDDATERHQKEQALQKALEEKTTHLQEITALNQKLQTISKESRMPESALLRSSFQPVGQKRSILVVEDSDINREILIELLQEEFNILTAENGTEGIAMLKEHREQLSLVLLDVYMPVCDGFEFLEQTQSDPYLSSVPVIVATGSDKREDEEKCLRLGATDFITKPYNLETMVGRIHNVIRLRESISELSVVEYDKLTELYTMSAFLHHAAQMLAESDAVFDLGALSILDFSNINRLYGEKKGNELLAFLGKRLKESMPDMLLARQGSVFYGLRRTSPAANEGEYFKKLLEGCPVANLRLRQGLYLNVDKSQPVSILCDRAKLAATSLDNNQTQNFAFYVPAMEQKLLEEQKMLLVFDSAIQKHEFVTWIQPKVDIDTGKIVAGEALVRWIDSEGKFISPGAFIPLFEREGQIQQLDEYIFRTVCAYQHQQKQLGNRVVPISINLSRNSLFHKGIVEIYSRIAREEQTDLRLVPIEITESAATSERQIKGICDEFVQAGFILQMDDFGAGYSSLSALATLPFKVIKLDKSLIDQIGTGKGDVIIKHAIDIAHELGMKVVAEGVEEQSQVEFLSLVECDQIQGYFFSPPRKTPLFEELLAKENPFGENGQLAKIHNDGIIRISGADLRRYLKVCKILFSAVRLLDTDCHGYCMANSDGSMEALRKPCHEIWNRNERCQNCISLRTMKTKKTEHKFEVFEKEVYSVYSCYVEVDGKPHIIELLSTVGTGMLHGYEENPTLLELVQNDHIELFQDVQLGCYNRRFFEERQYCLERISALAMIDIDNFKTINDEYGHLIGDAVLKAISETIKAVIRETDYLIRMGGDELMIGFVGMKKNRLQRKLEEIRRAVEGICLPENPDVHPTISVGGAFCRGYSEQVRQTADEALYEAKRRKNTVVIW